MCVLMGLDEACHLASQFEYDARLVGWLVRVAQEYRAWVSWPPLNRLSSLLL